MTDINVHELITQEFITHIWRKKVLHQKTTLSEKISRSFDIQFLEHKLSDSQYLKRNNAMLKAHQSNFDQYPTSFKEIESGWAKGFSLQIFNFEHELHYSCQLLQFARELERFLMHPLESISLFISPPYSQALPFHVDGREIFTLQIKGKKQWKFIARPELEDIEESFELTLNSHGILYVPANLPHTATSLDQFSISLAFVYRPVTYKSILNHVISKKFSKIMEAYTLPILSNENNPTIFDHEVKNLLNDIKNKIQSIQVEEVSTGLYHDAVESISKPPIHFGNIFHE